MDELVERIEWIKEKEKLKLRFEAITDKYSLFDEVDSNHFSEKLQDRLAKTKEELHKLIADL
jgi:hypothetical protein